MLDKLTKSSFDEHLGGTFRLRVEPNGSVELELLEVMGLASHAERGESFSVVFRAPMDAVLPQKIHKLEHDSMGSIELFLVPIGPDEHGMRYEAVFN